ncbi:30S ribosomal protein S12 methylthiotransferase RimO [uncultured Duncaniella sp.]|uniref:30S ribosomal protein S12 methylthiotransferase RimO n=1 Tax=uncultured Duncaniella sp. TaxID=2768039 RepID=UPI002675BE0A|nr:30S ribosomal protein S12 methylthiotransferase RimO [uncultured Duncaniella sp.]MCI9172470.1 30S ribosomal protein S12 methylthiotransferase RimO [Muribaculaceae bacterium]
MTGEKIAVISLGCSKNLVDSERLMRMLENVGYQVVEADEAFLRARKGKHVVINTCGFIGDAKEESINEILGWAELRKAGKIQGLYVMGCLSQRYSAELPAELPEVDRWYGKTDWPALVTDLARKHPATAPYDRILTTPRHHAYLKIAEGCDRFCAFCAIPLITGRYKSRPVEEIIEEVKMLVGRGVKEFNVIAQDLTSYGKDLYGTPSIARLVDAIADVEGVEWIRLHYAYPNEFPMDLLDVMASRPNVCRYLDIALQHISDNVLSNMRRHITGAETRALLAEIRKRVPGIHLRTTLMVGFPGEGEKEFDELMDFVREQRFERMGAFAYCEEEDTYAARHFDDSIPDEVKQSRLARLMELQEEISAGIQDTKVGSVQRVIIDREEPDYYVGRTQYDSPEVDPEVLVEKSVTLRPGEFCDVEITSSAPFELIGRPV